MEELTGSELSVGSMLEGISFVGLFIGFVFSTFGLWMLKRAKDRGNPKLIFIAIALLVYPYFVGNPWGSFAIGSALCFTAYCVW
jgi:hypothetical protein